MIVNDRLVQFLIERDLVPGVSSRKDKSDAFWARQLGKALAEQTMPIDDYRARSASDRPVVCDAHKRFLVEHQIVEGVTEFEGSDDFWETNMRVALERGLISVDQYLKLFPDDEEGGDPMTTNTKSPDPGDVFAQRGNGNDGIRVKSPGERLSNKRWTAKNTFGEVVLDPIYKQEVASQSQLDAAKVGVLVKHLANRSGAVSCPLTEFERNLLAESCENDPWAGKIGQEHFSEISGHRNVKQLIDDAVSGGLEIAPIHFDQDIYSVPLLRGELFPEVDLREVPRGRRIEGASSGAGFWRIQRGRIGHQTAAFSGSQNAMGEEREVRFTDREHRESRAVG